MLSDPEYMALIGIFLGVIARMAIPFLRKKAALPEPEKAKFTFEMKYLFAGALACIIAIVTTFIGFLAFPVPENVSALFYLITAIVYGFGLDGIIIEVMKVAFD